MKDLNVNVTSDNGLLVVRTGEAETLYDPTPLRLSGTITAPADFAEKRKELIDKDKSNVVANYTNRTITLTVDERDKFSDSVNGTLSIFPELKEMGINGKATMTHFQMLNLLKFKGAWFKNKDQHLALLTALKEFDAKVNQQFQNANDFKGSQATKKVVDIKTNLGLEFTLNIPIFAGGDNVSFHVDINVDVSDGGIVFWFESVGLHELITKETEEVFSQQLERLSDFVIVKIW